MHAAKNVVVLSNPKPIKSEDDVMEILRMALVGGCGLPIFSKGSDFDLKRPTRFVLMSQMPGFVGDR